MYTITTQRLNFVVYNMYNKIIEKQNFPVKN